MVCRSVFLNARRPLTHFRPPSLSFPIHQLATHHGCDDFDKMIKGDAGMEDIYLWDSAGRKSEAFRGATGGGDGVHILTGPIFVNGAEAGDILKVDILVSNKTASCSEPD